MMYSSGVLPLWFVRIVLCGGTMYGAWLMAVAPAISVEFCERQENNRQKGLGYQATTHMSLSHLSFSDKKL